MTLPADTVRKLSHPLDPRRVHHREGPGGKDLDYIASHDAIRTANAIFGHGGWGHDVMSLDLIGDEKFTSKRGSQGYRAAYRCTVRLTVTGCQPTSGVGYGDGEDYTGSVLKAHELAMKEAESDAMKRALKNFGDQFGLILYAKAGPERERAEREARVRLERMSAGAPDGTGVPSAADPSEGEPAAASRSGGVEATDTRTAVPVATPKSVEASSPSVSSGEEAVSPAATMGAVPQPTPATPEAPADTDLPSASAGAASKTISAAQQKRLWTIARKNNVPDDIVKATMIDLANVSHTADIPKGKYDTIVTAVQGWVPPEGYERPMFQAPAGAAA